MKSLKDKIHEGILDIDANEVSKNVETTQVFCKYSNTLMEYDKKNKNKPFDLFGNILNTDDICIQGNAAGSPDRRLLIVLETNGSVVTLLEHWVHNNENQFTEIKQYSRTLVKIGDLKHLKDIKIPQ